MKKIIIIDGNSLAFGRLPKKSESDKVTKSAVDQRDIYITRKFMKKILKLMFGIFWGYELVVTFDERNKFTFRHEMSDKYKRKKLSEKRREQKEYIYNQIEEIKLVLDSLGIPHYSHEKWEADDIIGMLSKHLEQKDYLITIISGDKDILQLISKKTRVAYIGQTSFFEIYDRHSLANLTDGLWPDQIIDIKILCGDKSDNIKGLGIRRGSGKNFTLDYWTEAEANKYIKKYHSVEGMLKNINEIPEPYKGSLSHGKEKIEFNRKLVTIVKDWKLDISPKHFNTKQIKIEDNHSKYI